MLPASGTMTRPVGSRLRRRLVIAGIVAGALALLVVIGVLVVYPRVGRWMVEDKVIPRLEAKLGRDIQVGSIEVGRGHAVLRDVIVRGPHDGTAPLVHIDRIDVDFDFWASLLANPVVGAVVIDGIVVAVRRDAAGADNVRDVLERLGVIDGADADAEPGARRGMGSLRPTRIELRRGSATASDEHTGATASVARFDGAWAPGEAAVVRATDARATTSYGPSAAAKTLTASVDDVTGRRLEATGGELKLWTGLKLTGITGSIAPGDGGHFIVAAEGGYGGVEGRLWTASGWIDPRAEATSLDLQAERFTLDRLRPVLEEFGVIAYEQASVDARLHIDVTPAGATFAGGFHVRDLSVDHPMLAEKPVHGLELGGEVAGDFDRDARTLTLTRADLESRGLPFSITGFVAAPGGLRVDGVRRERPALDLRLVIPKKPCQEVLGAIPIELTPYLQGFVLTGNFDTNLRIAIDWSDIPATVLDGRVGIFGCRGKQAPDDVMRLKEQFEHYVEVELDQWISFVVGPDNPDFVPIDDVSPYLLGSLMTTEDSAFQTHHGFIVREFRTALIKDLEAGYFKYGASSITMQLVKNVLLYREEDRGAEAPGAVPDLVHRDQVREGPPVRDLRQRDRVRPGDLRHRPGRVALLRQAPARPQPGGVGVLLVDPAVAEGALRPVLQGHAAQADRGQDRADPGLDAQAQAAHPARVRRGGGDAAAVRQRRRRHRAGVHGPPQARAQERATDEPDEEVTTAAAPTRRDARRKRRRTSRIVTPSNATAMPSMRQRYAPPRAGW